MLDAAESVFTTLFPADCRICGDPLLNASRLPVCTYCLCKIQAFQKPQCYFCGEIIFSTLPANMPVKERLCGVCQRVRPRFDRAYAFGPYDGTLRDLIQLLKYQRVRTAAVPLGKALAQALLTSRMELKTAHALVPVPLHRSKHHHRGFNQAEEIARAAQKVLKQNGWEIPVEHWLARVRPTTSQTGLTRPQRRANVRGAFQTSSGGSSGGSSGIMAGKNIILVDDVLTTGTTAQECARVLRRAKAGRVWVATAARVSKIEAVMEVVLAARANIKVDQEGRTLAAHGTAAGE